MRMKPKLGSTLIKGHPINDGLVARWVMNEGGGVVNDLSGNGNTGTLVSQAQWASGTRGSCIYVPSSDDYVEVADSPSLRVPSAFSFVVWQNTSDVSYTGILSKTSLDSDYGDYCLRNGSGEISLHVNDNDGSVLAISSTPANEWCQCVGTYDGADLRIYLNGRFENSAAYSTPITGSAESLYLGTYYTVSGYNKGYINDILIYNRALTASEIASLYVDPHLGIQEPGRLIMISDEAVVVPSEESIFMGCNF